MTLSTLCWDIMLLNEDGAPILTLEHLDQLDTAGFSIEPKDEEISKYVGPFYALRYNLAEALQAIVDFIHPCVFD